MGAYDVIVVGGGHAGIEAAWAAARLGARVGLVTSNPERIGLMPCNPAVGGPGKSQLVAEVEALGGLMGKLADATAIHTRVLNRSKGPAVQSLRVQVDRDLYALEAQRVLLGHPQIESVRAEVAALWVEQGVLCGVQTVDGRRLPARAVVVASGTFYKGWSGMEGSPGPQGDKESPLPVFSPRAYERWGIVCCALRRGRPPASRPTRWITTSSRWFRRMILQKPLLGCLALMRRPAPPGRPAPLQPPTG